jgi:hypothetical protein
VGLRESSIAAEELEITLNRRYIVQIRQSLIIIDGVPPTLVVPLRMLGPERLAVFTGVVMLPSHSFLVYLSIDLSSMRLMLPVSLSLLVAEEGPLPHLLLCLFHLHDAGDSDKANQDDEGNS